MQHEISENPLVSVIIPTYNRAKLLPTAIKSLIDQSYSNLEIIVVDDGSTDETKHVLKPLENKIRYLSSDHQGTANARNIGMKAARGEYIAFLDSDDTYLPYKLALQVDFIKKHPSIGMVCTEFSGRFEDGSTKERLLRYYHPVWDAKGWTFEDVFTESGTFSSPSIDRPIQYYTGDIFKYVLQDTLIASNTIFFRREILDVVGYQDLSYRFGQEYEFVVRICKHFPVAFLDIPTYVLLFHENQATAAFMKESDLSRDETLLEIENWNGFFNVVKTWGYNDKEFFNRNRKLVNNRLSEISYFIGKRWLLYGDRYKAMDFFKSSFNFRKLNIKLFIYMSLSLMPRKIMKTILGLSK